MKIEIDLDVKYSETTILIRSKEMTPELNEVIKAINALPNPGILLGHLGDQTHLIQPTSLVRIYSDNKKVFAETDDTTYQLRQRLYEIEERVSQPFLIRISNSEIVNFNKVMRLDFSLNGTICIIFQNGARSFVSRRYMQSIKQYLNL